MIHGFRGPHRYLSNFWLCEIVYGYHRYGSTEAAYQAQKTTDELLRKEFSTLGPKDAKDRGSKLVLRPDWDLMKNGIMFELTLLKFSTYDALKEQLLATGDQILIEGNTWHDNYWGSCTCERCGDRGHNQLGFILMDVRTILKDARNT